MSRNIADVVELEGLVIVRGRGCDAANCAPTHSLGATRLNRSAAHAAPPSRHVHGVWSAEEC